MMLFWWERNVNFQTKTSSSRLEVVFNYLIKSTFASLMIQTKGVNVMILSWNFSSETLKQRFGSEIHLMFLKCTLIQI